MQGDDPKSKGRRRAKSGPWFLLGLAVAGTGPPAIGMDGWSAMGAMGVRWVMGRATRDEEANDNPPRKRRRNDGWRGTAGTCHAFPFPSSSGAGSSMPPNNLLPTSPAETPLIFERRRPEEVGRASSPGRPGPRGPGPGRRGGAAHVEKVSGGGSAQCVNVIKRRGIGVTQGRRRQG